MNLNDLKNKLAAILASARGIFEEAKRSNREELTQEELTKLDGFNTDAEKLRATIGHLERLEAAETGVRSRTGRPDPDPLPTANADQGAFEGFRAWALGLKAKSSDAIEAARSAGYDFFSNVVTFAYRSAMSTLTDGAGKYTVETELSKAVEVARKKFGSVTSIANVFTTEKGNPLAFTTVNDTAVEGDLIAQLGEIEDEGDGPTFGRVSLGAFKVASETVPVSSEMLQDSSINVPAFLGELLGARVYRKVQKLLTTGAGTTEPFGIVTRASWTVAPSGAGFDWYTELIKLVHSVDPEYRLGDKVAFMMNDATVADLRQVRYSDGGGFVWQDDVQAGDPAISGRLLGYRVVINQAMTAAAGGAKAVLFGDFSKFLVRQVGELEIKRFDEKYADIDAIGFRAQVRIDADLLAAASSYPIKGIQLPADYTATYWQS